MHFATLLHEIDGHSNPTEGILFFPAATEWLGKRHSITASLALTS